MKDINDSLKNQARGPYWGIIESLSTCVFETRMATGSELFPLLTCLQTTTFTLLSIFSPLEVIHIKIWETPLSWHTKCSLPVAVHVSKTRVLKLLVAALGPYKNQYPPVWSRASEVSKLFIIWRRFCERSGTSLLVCYLCLPLTNFER